MRGGPCAALCGARQNHENSTLRCAVRQRATARCSALPCVAVSGLKHIDEFSDIMKMCSWTVEVQSNYYVQRGPRGCAAMFSFIPILELREINLTEKSAFRTFSRGSSESLRRALLVAMNNHSVGISSCYR